MSRFRNININLLPSAQFAKKPLGKLINWLLIYGRHIVTITEFMVLMAFFSRFVLDAKLADINESINEKKSIVEATAYLQEEYLRLQNKLAAVENFSNEHKEILTMVKTVKDIFSPDSTLQRIALDKDSLQISATSFSLSSLRNTLEKIKLAVFLKEVKLTSVTFSTKTNSVNFSISAKVDFNKLDYGPS